MLNTRSNVKSSLGDSSNLLFIEQCNAIHKLIYNREYTEGNKVRSEVESKLNFIKALNLCSMFMQTILLMSGVHNYNSWFGFWL